MDQDAMTRTSSTYYTKKRDAAMKAMGLPEHATLDLLFDRIVAGGVDMTEERLWEITAKFYKGEHA